MGCLYVHLSAARAAVLSRVSGHGVQQVHHDRVSAYRTPAAGRSGPSYLLRRCTSCAVAPARGFAAQGFACPDKSSSGRVPPSSGAHRAHNRSWQGRADTGPGATPRSTPPADKNSRGFPDQGRSLYPGRSVPSRRDGAIVFSNIRRRLARRNGADCPPVILWAVSGRAPLQM
jgi:hypothetical protein